MEKNTEYRLGETEPHKVAGNVLLEAGNFASLNARGFAVPAESEDAKSMLGRIEKTVDNRSGVDGDEVVVISRKRQFAIDNDESHPVTQTHIGDTCLFELTGTVSMQHKVEGYELTRFFAGAIRGLTEDGQVWVEVA